MEMERSSIGTSVEGMSTEKENIVLLSITTLKRPVPLFSPPRLVRPGSPAVIPPFRTGITHWV